MIIQIEMDFNSDEALYLQLCNQIIQGIARNQIHEGDVLPSVRNLADVIGINMHTVNKAYALLRQEGFIKLDRRKGAVICVDLNKIEALNELQDGMAPLLVRAFCKGISREDAKALVDRFYDQFD